MAIGTAAAMLGGSLISGFMGSRAAGRAADAQERSAERQIQYSEDTRDMIFDRLAPYERTGRNALRQYADYFTNPNGEQMLQDRYMRSPGFDASMDAGREAIEGSAAARGGLFSGNTLRALQETGQNLYAQDYGNWYGRYMGGLAGLADMGPQAATGSITAATNTNSMVNNALGQAGNARSAGIIGGANAWTGAIDNALGGFGYMTAINGGNSPFGGNALAPTPVGSMNYAGGLF